jgi:hypothetical protein
MQHGHLPTIAIPYRLAKTAPAITHQQRLEHIQQLLEPECALRPLESRSPTAPALRAAAGTNRPNAT